MIDLYSMSDLVPIYMAWLSAGVAMHLTNYLDTQGVEVAQDYRHTTVKHVEIVQLNLLIQLCCYNYIKFIDYGTMKLR